MDLLKFNINCIIYVKLTERGREKLAENHNAYIDLISNWEHRDADFYKKKEDHSGYTQFQMWNLMNEFGKDLICGGTNYFHLDILLKKQDCEEMGI